MFTIQGRLESDWPLIEVNVAAHSKFPGQGQPGLSFPVTMLIDTGANQSHVPMEVIKRLGLPLTDTTTLTTAGLETIVRPKCWLELQLHFTNLLRRTEVARFRHEVAVREPAPAGDTWVAPYEGILGVSGRREFLLAVDWHKKLVRLSCSKVPGPRP